MSHLAGNNVWFRPFAFYGGYHVSNFQFSEILIQKSTTTPEAIVASISEKITSEALLGHGGQAFNFFSYLWKDDIVNDFVTYTYSSFEP